MYDDEEIQEAYQEKDKANFLYDQQAYRPDRIDDSFAFKSKILEISPDIAAIIKPELLLANFTEKEKTKAYSYLSLALDLREFGLDSYKIFRDEVLLICGITRGYKGFQQDKLNEQRDIRTIQTLKERKPKFWRRGGN